VTPKFMKEKFNPETPNHPDVAYFSIGGSKKIAPSHPLYFCQRILTKFEGKSPPIPIVSHLLTLALTFRT